MNQETRLDWCSHAAAKYAVENWHYSRRMPKSKLAKIGVWERGQFVGALIYGAGAAPEIGSPYGLTSDKVCELVRVALRDHTTPVSRVLSISVKMLTKAMPGLRAIVSFADTSQGHHGGIYQAAGWVFTGSQEYHAYRVLGEVVHPRALHLRYGTGGQSIPWLRANIDPQAERIHNGTKHKYVLPLDAGMRSFLRALALPYPKRERMADSGRPDPTGRGGASPTRSLQPLAG
jgi:hypothetical protein